MRWRAFSFAFAFAFTFAFALGGTAFGHAFNPALLDLRRVAGDRYQVDWRRPPEAQRIEARFPADCVLQDDELACPGGLQGRTVSLSGLGDTDVLVRITDGETTQTAVLRQTAASWTVPSNQHATPPLLGYLRLGVEHILGGFDHLLFVLGLLLLVKRRLFWTLTAFTVAHSLTLAAAMLGLVHVPQAPVEAAIALSIFGVAVELMRDGPSLTRERPWVVAFAFGLLHGLGFAGALGQIGLPPGQVAAALLAFNLGVELGQIAFVGAVLAVIAVARRARLRVPRWAPAYVIGSCAAFWSLERIASFWS